MARYKPYDYGQSKLLAVSFDKQILPGTFEYTVHRFIDEHVDLKPFAAHYRNERKGARAYDPAILLKIVLFAYARGITRSREIAELARENVVCMALSADTVPHFTTIADFVARLHRDIVSVFRDCLLVCEELKLIGKEMFAIDGVKLPSNAAKEWSGTKEELGHKVQKMQQVVERLLQRHQAADAQDAPAELESARQKRIQTLEAAIAKVKGFVAEHEDKLGASGKPIKSNITDNDSAKMKTSKGVIQGYAGVALVDAQHQVVVAAEAFGEGQEHGLLVPVLEQARESFAELGIEPDLVRGLKLAADAGYHSEANLEYLEKVGVDGYVADTQFRKRDERFASAERHQPQQPQAEQSGQFRPEDFSFDPQKLTCVCPAGKRLYRNGRNVTIKGYAGVKFQAAKRDCRNCPLRSRCLRHPERTAARQVVFFSGPTPAKRDSVCAKMRRKIDSALGRHEYSKRLGIVEPVFANICSTRGLDRFTLRGKPKVNGQWMLFCLVHNLGKVQRYGKLEQYRRQNPVEQ